MASIARWDQSLGIALFVVASSLAPARAQTFAEPLTAEPVPSAISLPAVYPHSWIFAHDLHFNSLVDGRIAIVDLAATDRNLRGQLPAAQFGNLLAASTRSELYVAETFHSRLTRGARTDVVSIRDRRTLQPTGEIVLPGARRGQFVTQLNSFQFTNQERWALVFNFDPGSSVTVVDLVGRRVLNTIDVPGCSLIYPTGARGFSTLCADGALMTVALDAQGRAAGSTTLPAINDIDADPMFMTPAMHGSTAWFATFRGRIRGFDFAGARPRKLGDFAMPTGGAGAKWRPGGWQVLSADSRGRLYLLMNPDGADGSHKDGGTEAWVVDPRSRRLVRRIPLVARSVSLEVTQDTLPLLAASRPGVIDVYDATTGAHRRAIGGAIAHDPMVMSAVRH